MIFLRGKIYKVGFQEAGSERPVCRGRGPGMVPVEGRRGRPVGQGENGAMMQPSDASSRPSGSPGATTALVPIWAGRMGPLFQVDCPGKRHDLKCDALSAGARQTLYVNYCLGAPQQLCELGLLCPCYPGETE